MSTRKINSLIGIFAISLCLTGCLGRDTETVSVEDTQLFNAKNAISPEKTESEEYRENVDDE